MARTNAGRRRSVQNHTYALSFPATGTSTMNIGNDVYLYERTQAWTIGFQIQPVDYQTGSGRHIFSEYESSSPFRGRLIRIDTSLLRFWLVNTFSSNELKVNYRPPARNAFTQVIMAYDGSSTAAGVQCWFNGILQTQVSATETLSGTIVATGVATKWGGWTGAAVLWKGLLGECFIDARQWTQAAVDSYFYDRRFSLGTPTDLWSMTEGSGGVAASTGTGVHNGTVAANVTWSSVTPTKPRSAIAQNRLPVS